MTPSRPSRTSFAVSALFACVLLTPAACKKPDATTGVVADSGAPAVVQVEAGPVDTSQCPGCQLQPQLAWTFEGVFSDSACTQPLAETAAPACAAVPALGAATVTYVDEIGGRKANETAGVTLVEQVAPEAPRYRKNAKACVRANEIGLHVAPATCAGQKVCRDATGALACAGCRTFANGCPDFAETRVYATINDPAIKGAKGGSGVNGNVARLLQCCNALAAQAKSLGNSPEAGVVKSAAAQCSALAKAAGPSGNAPELGAIRTMMAGRNIPAICAGF